MSRIDARSRGETPFRLLPPPSSLSGDEVVIAGRRIKIGGPAPEPREGEKLKTYTTSICPQCYRLLPAIIVEREGRIWIRKICPDHGEIEEVYYEDADMYSKFMRFEDEGKGVRFPYVPVTAPCPYSCGLCPMHKNHTALLNLVVTNRCNLSCWYCLPRDQEVMVRRNGKVTLITVEELAKYYRFEHKVHIDGFTGEYTVPDDLELLSYDNGRIVWRRATKFLRRIHKGDVLVVRTRTGREVKVTPEHKFMVLADGKLVRKEARELKPGDKVLVAATLPRTSGGLRRINLIEEFKKLGGEASKVNVHGLPAGSIPSRKHGNEAYSWAGSGTLPLNVSYKASPGEAEQLVLGLDAAQHGIPALLEITRELAKLVGYFVADGHYTSRDIRITAADREVLEELVDIAKKLGLPFSIMVGEGKAPQVAIGGGLLRLVFKHVFGIPGGAPNKRLPRQAFEFPLDLKLALLSALFNGDGSVEKEEKRLALVYATTSKGLARDIVYLLLSLGIFPRIYRVPKEKYQPAKHSLYKITISGKELEKLAPLLELKSRHKERLRGYAGRREIGVERLGNFIVDEITEIVRERYEGIVYDFEVDSRSHVFVANDGILVSNCFFFAEAAGYVYEPSLEQIRFMIRQLAKQGVTMAVQITGGEPMLRDDLVEIVKLLKEEGVRHIQLNTQALRVAELYLKDPRLAADYVRKLREAGVNTVYMSFDGVSPRVNWKNHWEIPFIFDAFRKAGMTSIVLVPTVIRNVNTHELGDIVRFAGKHIDIVRGVNFQPVSLTGMMKKHERMKFRITVPGAVKLIEEQTDGQIHRDAWYPVPVTTRVSKFIEQLTGEPQFTMANHPVCGAATYVVVADKDMNGVPRRFVPITDFLDVEGFAEYLEEKAEELKKGRSKTLLKMRMFFDIVKFVDREKMPKELDISRLLFKVFIRRSYEALGELHYKMLFLGMMHFMDLYNYDVERVMRCNIHYSMPDGRIVPFCAFNVLNDLYRDFVQEQYKVPPDEWARRRGGGALGITVKYRRNRKLMESHPLYRETYKGILF